MRLSVVLGTPPDWRVKAITAELAGLGLPAEVTRTGGRDATVVRTPFAAELLPLAQRWTAGAVKRAPPRFRLDGARLRWWCLGAGRSDGSGFSLALDPAAEASWQVLGAALAAEGVPGTLVGPRADGPAYRITSSRRLARLRELAGDPPPGAGQGDWPDAGRHPQRNPAVG